MSSIKNPLRFRFFSSQLRQQKICDRIEEADRLPAKQVERVRYEAELAQRRYMQVDPGNRLVADVLEAEWNKNLGALEDARADLNKQRQSDRLIIDVETRARVLALANDFLMVWGNPNTSDRDHKRMVRLFIEDVTLTRKKEIIVQIRFKGGTVATVTQPIAAPSYKSWETPPEVITGINRYSNVLWCLPRQTPKGLGEKQRVIYWLLLGGHRR